MFPFIILGAIAALALSSENKPKEKGKLGAIKVLNRRNYRGSSEIEINSIKPQASIDAINKIIDGKVTGYDLDVAYTGSMYLRFEVPERETYFSIRVSDHSKIDGVDDDLIIENDSEIEINIFSNERKKEALEYLKKYFSTIKKTENSFTNKVQKKVLKTKYPEVIENYLKKIKVDTTKTKKQVQEQVLQKLLKMKPKGTLTKKEYTYVRGSWRYDGEKKIDGIITHISTTGNQVTIGNQTGKEFLIKNELHNALALFATGSAFHNLENVLQNKK